jgi:hypothetical protein
VVAFGAFNVNTKLLMMVLHQIKIIELDIFEFIHNEMDLDGEKKSLSLSAVAANGLFSN